MQSPNLLIGGTAGFSGDRIVAACRFLLATNP